jgi:hypothetical protein
MAILKNTTINDTGLLRIPSGGLDQRPIVPIAQSIRYNTLFQEVEFFNGSTWEFITMSSSRVVQIKTAMSGPARQVISSITPVALTGLSISFTPKYTSSIIIIEAQIITNLAYVSSFGVFRDGVATVNTTGQTNTNEPNMQSTTFTGSTTTDWLWSLPLLYSEISGSTNTRTYQIFGTSGWSNTAYSLIINNRNANDMASFSHMTVMELTP